MPEAVRIKGRYPRSHGARFHRSRGRGRNFRPSGSARDPGAGPARVTRRTSPSRSAAPRTSCSSTWRRRSAARSASSRSTPGGCTRRPTSSSRRCATTTASRSRPSSRSPRRCRRSCARRACSRSTRTATRSAAASARSSRWSRALPPLAAWITGQRRDQSPGTRAEVPVVQLDPTFGSPERPLVKFNPLANWTSKQVWAYIREHDVPVQRAARPRLRLDRLRALHAARQPRPARARRALVVGRGDHEGVRSPRRQRD